MQSHYTTATTVDFVEAGGVAPSSRAYHARALLLSYTSVGQSGWIFPSGLRFPKPALVYPNCRTAELHPDECPRLESNQHLLDFSQAPSPDRLRGHRCGRGRARPRASSSIRFSESALVAQQSCSGTRIRTSTS